MIVTVDEVKTHLRIEDDVEDMYLESPDRTGADRGGGLLPCDVR